MTESSSGGRDSLSSWIWPWIFILALALALFFCLWMHLSGPRSIQAAVSECVAPVIGSTSLKTGNVEVHGRDVHLSGEVDSRLDQAALVMDLEQLDCTYRVVNNLVPVDREPSNLQITAFGDSVTIMGGLPSQADVDLVHAAVASRYQADGVENQIQILKQGSEARWLDGVDEYVGHMALADPSGIDVNDKRVTLTGVVRSEETKTELGDKAAAAFLGQVPIVNQIEVKSPRSSASLQYEVSDSGVILSGEMPDQQGIDQAVEIAATAFDADQIDNQLVVNSDVKPAPWLPALRSAMTPLSQIPGASLSAEDAGLVLDGVVDAPERRQEVEDVLRANLADMPVDNRIAVDIPRSSAKLSIAFPSGPVGRVQIAGALASTDAVDATLAAVGGQFSEDRIDNSLTVSQEALPAPWLDGVSSLLAAYAGADHGSFAIDDASVAVSGLVDAAAKKDAIVEAASALGVGTVDDQIEILARESASITYTYNDGHIDLNGELADADQVTAAVSAAEDVFGADAVSNNLTVGERLNNPVWLDAVNSSLADLRAFESAELVATDRGINLAGVVTDESTRDATMASLSSVDDIAVQDAVQVLPYASPDLRFRKSGARLRVDGTLASQEEHDAVSVVAAEVFGADNIDNAIVVGERVAPASWLANITAALPYVQALDSGMLSASNERISVNGIVDDENKKEALVTSVAAAAGDIALSEAVEVHPYQSPSIYYALEAGRVNIEGTLSSRQDVASAVEAANAVFGSDNVDSALIVGERHSPATWLEAVNSALPNLSSLESGALSVSVDGVSVTGITDEEEKKQSLIGALQSAAGDIVVDETVTVSPYMESAIDYAIEGDRIRLAGTLSTQDEVDAATAAAVSVYGADNVDNELIIGERHRPAAWLGGINSAADALRNLENGQLSASDAGVKIAGLTDADDKKTAILDALSVAAGDGVIDESIEVRPYAGATLRLETNENKILLAGTLSNEQEVDDIVAAATAVYGEDNVGSELTVGERYRPANWLGGIASSLVDLAKLETGTLTADDSGIAVSGVVDAAEKKQQLIATLGGAAEEIVFSEDVAVMPYASPSLSYQIEDATVGLEGELANQDEVDAALAAATSAFGADAIENRLIVGERHRPAAWLAAVNGAVDVLRDLEQGSFAASDDLISVDGITDEDNKKDAIVTAMSGAAGEIAFTEAITVVPYENGAIRYDLEDAKIRLVGVLATSAEVDAATAAANAAFGEENVDSQLTVGERHREAAWLTPINDAMVDLAALEYAALEASDVGISVSGQTDTEEKKSTLLNSLGSAQDTGGLEISENVAVVPFADPSIVYAIDGTKLRLEGTLASQAEIDATHDVAVNQYGADNVENLLVVGERHREANWLDGINDAMATTSSLESGRVEADPNTLRVSGVVDSDATKEGIVTALAAVAGEQSFSEAIDVVPYASSAVQYHIDNGALRLEGVLASEEEIEYTVAGVAVIFGADNVSSGLRVGERHKEAEWLDAVNGAVAEGMHLESGLIRASDDAISVRGVTDTESKKESIVAGLSQAAGSIPFAETIQVMPYGESAVVYTVVDGGIRLSGTLSSESEAADAANAANQAFGADNVENQLRVGERFRPADWLTPINGRLADLTQLERGELSASDRAVSIRGETDAEQKRASVIASMAEGAGTIPFTEAVTVTPRPSSEITYRFRNESTLSIEGVLADAEAIETAKEGARNYGGASGITSSVAVDRVKEAAWLPGVTELLAELRTVDSGTVTANDDSIVLSGSVSEVERRDEIGALAVKMLPDSKIDNRILVVVPMAQKTITQALTDLDLPGIQFEIDSAELRPSSRQILDGVAQVLSAFPDVRVEIAGHTDADGEDVYNIDLSSRRTETVLSYLTRAGVDPSRMQTRGYGESRPIADNETEEGKAINRRIEFNVLE